MTAATMTPDTRKILTNIRNHGPATARDMGSLFAPRPADGAARAAKREWTDAMIRAHQGLSELEQSNRIVRVVTRRGVWFMTAGDAAEFIMAAQNAIDHNAASTTS